MNKKLIRTIITLLVLTLLIPCIGFAQDNNRTDLDYKKDPGYRPTSKMAKQSIRSYATSWERNNLFNREITNVKWIWDEDEGNFKAVYENSDNLARISKNSELTCTEMLKRTWIEPDSVLHNCPEHELVMLYKCPNCQATSLGKGHKCVEK